jgi:hypothetical protein
LGFLSVPSLVSLFSVPLMTKVNAIPWRILRQNSWAFFCQIWFCPDSGCQSAPNRLQNPSDTIILLAKNLYKCLIYVYIGIWNTILGVFCMFSKLSLPMWSLTIVLTLSHFASFVDHLHSGIYFGFLSMCTFFHGEFAVYACSLWN